LDIPIFVENDANGAALAELSFGRRKGQSDLSCSFGVGVGTGMIFDRRNFRGSDGFAGKSDILALTRLATTKQKDGLP
jgi:glucokinase